MSDDAAPAAPASPSDSAYQDITGRQQCCMLCVVIFCIVIDILCIEGSYSTYEMTEQKCISSNNYDTFTEGVVDGLLYVCYIDLGMLVGFVCCGLYLFIQVDAGVASITEGVAAIFVCCLFCGIFFLAIARFILLIMQFVFVSWSYSHKAHYEDCGGEGVIAEAYGFLLAAMILTIVCGCF